MNKRLKEIVEAAKLEPITLYNLRHTGTSLFGEAGVHLSVAQHIADHSTSGITADVYTHSKPAMHRDAIAQVEQLVSDAKTETEAA